MSDLLRQRSRYDCCAPRQQKTCLTDSLLPGSTTLPQYQSTSTTGTCPLSTCKKGQKAILLHTSVPCHLQHSTVGVQGNLYDLLNLSRDQGQTVDRNFPPLSSQQGYKMLPTPSNKMLCLLPRYAMCFRPWDPGNVLMSARHCTVHSMQNSGAFTQMTVE